jgi:hydrogenase small subunit
MTPFYRHLPEIPGLGPHASLDKIGLGITVGVTAAFATHTAVHVARKSLHQAREAREHTEKEKS